MAVPHRTRCSCPECVLAARQEIDEIDAYLLRTLDVHTVRHRLNKLIVLGLLQDEPWRLTLKGRDVRKGMPHALPEGLPVEGAGDAKA